MDTVTEAALQAIIKALVDSAPDNAIPDAIVQNLYGMYEELRARHHPSEASDIGRLGDYARDVRNARISSFNRV